jgi:enoyl-CoA hydratase/carnithine racemase
LLGDAGKNFSAGLDLDDYAELLGKKPEGEVSSDIARNTINLIDFVMDMQAGFKAVAECRKPVIAAIQGACVGGGERFRNKLNLLTFLSLALTDLAKLFLYSGKCRV